MSSYWGGKKGENSKACKCQFEDKLYYDYWGNDFTFNGMIQMDCIDSGFNIKLKIATL